MTPSSGAATVRAKLLQDGVMRAPSPLVLCHLCGRPAIGVSLCTVCSSLQNNADHLRIVVFRCYVECEGVAQQFLPLLPDRGEAIRPQELLQQDLCQRVLLLLDKSFALVASRLLLFCGLVRMTVLQLLPPPALDALCALSRGVRGGMGDAGPFLEVALHLENADDRRCAAPSLEVADDGRGSAPTADTHGTRRSSHCAHWRITAALRVQREGERVLSGV
mmetsp:Transcript_31393/g.83176  ORF Transcript_31393/g.83176 Transcript_31393/m.83176 type:complete len:220 (-) Transcript_31393:136-795(-)